MTPSDERGPVVSVDLGHSNMRVAYADASGQAHVIEGPEGHRSTPAVVCFAEDGAVVGRLAVDMKRLDPEDAVTHIKACLAEPSFRIVVRGATYSAEDIVAILLRSAARDIRGQLGRAAEGVVLTCPAYFGEAEKHALQSAAASAGLHVLALLAEPVAAAVYYAHMRRRAGEALASGETVLVCDLGGMAFDAAVVAFAPDETFTLISVDGDLHLGAQAWTDAVMAYAADRYREQTGVEADLMDDFGATQDLMADIERAKTCLNQRSRTPLTVRSRGRQARMELTRERFEELTRPPLDRMVRIVQRVLSQARAKGRERLDAVLLVGGGARMPQVPARIERELGLRPVSHRPEEAVVLGSALWALGQGGAARPAE